MIYEDLTVGAEAIRDVLDGNVESLYSAFLWEYTPQGHNYWKDRAVGKVLLSDSDKDTLKQWLEDGTLPQPESD